MIRTRFAQQAAVNHDVMVGAVFWMREGVLSKAQKATEADWEGTAPED